MTNEDTTHWLYTLKGDRIGLGGKKWATPNKQDKWMLGRTEEVQNQILISWDRGKFVCLVKEWHYYSKRDFKLGNLVQTKELSTKTAEWIIYFFPKVYKYSKKCIWNLCQILGFWILNLTVLLGLMDWLEHSHKLIVFIHLCDISHL